MRIIQAKIQNFGSYAYQRIDFDKSGLNLISGATGSGKSTLCDIIPWVLFGKTAKNGAVDEVRSWNTSETKGEILLEIGRDKIRILRQRSPNDLILYVNEEPIRGKDLNDTQKIINDLLGVTLETFLAGAYMHEFSSTASFFHAPAKIRRQIIEELTDMTVINTLSEKIVTKKKEVKTTIAQLKEELISVKLGINFLKHRITAGEEQAKSFEVRREIALKELERKSKSFEKDKQTKIESMLEDHYLKLSTLENEIQDIESHIASQISAETKLIQVEEKLKATDKEVCDSCGAPIKNDQKLILVREKQKLQDLLYQRNQSEVILSKKQATLAALKSDKALQHIENEAAAQNAYAETIKAKQEEENLYEERVQTDKITLNGHQCTISELEQVYSQETQELSDLELLQDVVSAYRKLRVATTIDKIQSQTNTFLNNHFEGEIRVRFESQEADKLEVTVFKDGNLCSYTQLSKGQRQLLKLCFSASIMIAINNQFSFNLGFMDEALDGLDDKLKIKAYSMLEALSQHYDSLFIVEHNEHLKDLFSKGYSVKLVNGVSKLEKI
jgi:DNA repair exonuclease SbcCD ATPase subunit